MSIGRLPKRLSPWVAAGKTLTIFRDIVLCPIHRPKGGLSEEDNPSPSPQPTPTPLRHPPPTPNYSPFTNPMTFQKVGYLRIWSILLYCCRIVHNGRATSKTPGSRQSKWWSSCNPKACLGAVHNMNTYGYDGPFVQARYAATEYCYTDMRITGQSMSQLFVP